MGSTADVGLRSRPHPSALPGVRSLCCKHLGNRASPCRAVPVEILTDQQAEAYGKFADEPTRPELERFFFGLAD